MKRPLFNIVDILLSTDAYKLDHRRQYPVGTEYVYSNLTARGSRIDGVDATVFFGLQSWLLDFSQKWDEFFQLSEQQLEKVLKLYSDEVCNLLGVTECDTSHFRDLHALGYLPLRIRALEEGTVTPLRVPYLTVENTDPRFFWLTNYVETELSAEMWQPITSATIAWRARRLLDRQAERSGACRDDVSAQGHDFSCRGMAGMHAAARSGMGHLLSFTGSDTLPAVRMIRDHYLAEDDKNIASSIPATEHSVMMVDGPDGEFDTYKRLITEVYPSGPVAIVSDTWNLWNVIHEYLPRLKETIMSRDGSVIIRPDTGDPQKILLGDPDAPVGTPERQGVVHALWEKFGGTVNDKGFKILDPHIGVVYGDSITYERARDITDALIDAGFVSTTVTLGFGSFTYQYQTRDTFNMAMKATWVQVNGEGRNLIKYPVTGDGVKKSATGRLAVRHMMNGKLYLVEKAQAWQEGDPTLSVVFENGALPSLTTFRNIRQNLAYYTKMYDRWSENSISEEDYERWRVSERHTQPLDHSLLPQKCIPGHV